MESPIGSQEKVAAMRYHVLLLLLALAACQSQPIQQPASTQYSPISEIMAKAQPGDLIFRCGTGWYSDLFRQCCQRDPRYSHAGVLVRACDSLMVVHMETAERDGEDDIHLVSVQDFITASSEWGIYRLHANVQQCSAVAQYALALLGQRPRFDLDFDQNDTTALYCTEMVQMCINKGLVSPQLHGQTYWRGKMYVAPDELYRPDLAIFLLGEKP